MKILNLGCGNDIKIGAINCDISQHRPDVDVVQDLNDIQWIFADKSYDAIYALSVFEHLKPNLIEVLNECHRILVTGGILHLKYPHKDSPTIYSDPTHRWFWDAAVLDYVDPSTKYGTAYGFYTDLKWAILGKTMHKNLSVHAKLRTLK